MSDYISFEELWGISPAELNNRWRAAQFPFDLAVCGQCVTQHKFHPGLCYHKDFSEAASRLKVAMKPRPQELRANLAEIYALRMFHRDLYPSTPEPPTKAAALETAEIMSDQKLFKQIVGVAATLEEDTRLGRLHSFEEAFGEE